MAKKKSRRITIRRRGTLYYVRIDSKGRWMSWVRAGKSIKLDKIRKAKTKAKPGQKDRGD
jgi:hypothetical protein